MKTTPNGGHKPTWNAVAKQLAKGLAPQVLGPGAALATAVVEGGQSLKDKFIPSEAKDTLQGIKDTQKRLEKMALMANGSEKNQAAEAVVLITGAGRGNPHGHAAIGIPGKGLLNLGTSETGFDFGEKSVDDYIAGELPHRNVEVFTIPMSPAQRQQLEKALKDQDGRVDSMGERLSYATGQTCTRVSAQPLEQLGLIDHGPEAGLNPLRNLSTAFEEAFPSTLRARLQQRGYESVTKVHVADSSPGLEQMAADQFLRGAW